MNNNKDQEELKHLIVYYEQKVFALALYLIGGDRNKTYEVASSSSAETIQKSSSLEPIDPYKDIAMIFHSDEKNIQTQTIQARGQLIRWEEVTRSGKAGGFMVYFKKALEHD